MVAKHAYKLGCLCLLFILGGCSLAPAPLTSEQLELISRQDREVIFQDQEAFEDTLTLETAMALALKYNLENRVRLMEEAVANQQLDMSEIELLPSLATSAGYTDRNKPNASRSVSINSGNESLEPSTSQDLEKLNASARATWNLLDFGVSYLQAKQDADRYLIAQKTREKIMLTLMKEVRAAYWKAVAMEQMRAELKEISDQVDEMLDYWQSVREQRLRAPIAVLMDIRALVETRQQLDDIRRSIDTAQARLGNLINAPRFRDIKLPGVDDFPELEKPATDIEAMELVALQNSADYLSEVYKVRIDQLETRKAMRRLWPGLEFSYGGNYDDNSFLVFSNWNEFGINLTHDITRLIFAGRLKRFREASEDLAVARKLAVNMAVVTGVHITWQDYGNALIRLERAEYLQSIDEQISDLTTNAQMNAKESGAAAIQTRLRAFRSKIGRMQSYADAQAAYGEFMVSLGVNPIPWDYESMTVQELAAVLDQNFEQVMVPYSLEGEAMLANTSGSNAWESERDDANRLDLTTGEPVNHSKINASMSNASMSNASMNNVELDSGDTLVVNDNELPENELAVQEGQPDPVEEGTPAQANVAANLTPSRKEEDKSGTVDGSLEVAILDDSLVVYPASTAPDASRFLTDFLVNYFPQPRRERYLEQFQER